MHFSGFLGFFRLCKEFPGTGYLAREESSKTAWFGISSALGLGILMSSESFLVFFQRFLEGFAEGVLGISCLSVVGAQDARVWRPGKLSVVARRCEVTNLLSQFP